MSNRDDFSEKVRNAVAARAGWHCSMCQKLTVGPSAEAPDAFTKIGKAAHIEAAAPGRGARRYNAAMSPEERASISNAIWLCPDHADLIDRDEVTYSVAKLHAIKHDHEQVTALAVRAGTSTDLATGLLAIGPDVVCTGDLMSMSAGSWTLRLAHFLAGDLHKVEAFIAGFATMRPDGQYVLSNELGDGRVLVAAPTLIKEVGGYSLICPIAPRCPRIDAQKLGSSMAVHPDTNDLYLDEKGGIARVAGLDYLPQKVRTILSLNRGDSYFHPEFGMRFFEYYESFNKSPWLDLLLKLDVVRQASIPIQDKLMGKAYTPLQCVTRVSSVNLLADSPTANRLPIRIALEVQGVGEWVQEMSIFMPTADQVAERATVIAEMPWLTGAPTLPKRLA